MRLYLYPHGHVLRKTKMDSESSAHFMVWFWCSFFFFSRGSIKVINSILYLYVFYLSECEMKATLSCSVMSPHPV